MLNQSTHPSTAFEEYQNIPIIEDNAKIISIDRLASPYDPAKPNYIQTGLTLSEMEKLLKKATAITVSSNPDKLHKDTEEIQKNLKDLESKKKNFQAELRDLKTLANIKS